MYKDKKVIIQTILFAYPDVCMDKKQREEKHLAWADSVPDAADNVRVQGGSSIAPQERYLDTKEKDTQLQRANEIIVEIQKGLSKLSKDEYLVVREFFFERAGRSGTASALAMSESNVDKKIDRAFGLLQDYCSEIYHIFCQWRRIRDKERRDSAVIVI